MKPARGLSHSWLQNLPRERRMALLSAALLLLLLGAIVLYQQLRTPADPAPPTPTEQIPLSVEQAPPPPTTPAVQPAPSGTTLEPPASAPPQEAEPPAPAHLVHPLAGEPRMIKTYGSLDEAYGDFRLYTALAYQGQPGQAVLAAAGGQVAAVEQNPMEGLTLVLEHGGGMTTHYTGLGKVLVTEGARVEGGSIVAQVGAPGAARKEMGPHLAFQVRIDDSPVDPAAYLAN
ncbi:MAG: peptidoglycan DD-metalloendopeptidase family protein [Bacillota bacterium]